jgi:hypothetical protein
VVQSTVQTGAGVLVFAEVRPESSDTTLRRRGETQSTT